MRRITKEENKKLLVQELQVINDFCIENGISYSLAYGTLLGAIRHQGFIPWDDDIDIAMFRSDFNRFVNSFNKYNERYKVVSIENDSRYNLFVAKVIDTKTVLIEDVQSPYKLGVYVDIFIIDYLNEDKITSQKTIRKLNIFQNIYRLKTIKPRKGRLFIKNALLYISQFFLKPLDTNNILKKINKYSCSLSHKPTHLCGSLSTMVYGKKEIMKSRWYSSYKIVPFEDSFFYIPAGYHFILSKLYGKYMIPPAKEKQISHHINNVYWRD